MRRHFLGQLIGGVIVAGPMRAFAQGGEKPVVGLLLSGSETSYFSLDGLRAELRDTGAVLEVRAADGRYERLPALAAELVSLPSSVIVALSLPAALAAKGATRTIPVVFTSGADPVAFGLVASLSRPGGNLTGFTNYFGALGAKRLELLRELVPNVGVIAILVNPDNANARDHVDAIQSAARTLGQTTTVASATSETEIDAAFVRLSQERVRALLVSDDPAYFAKAKLLVGLAERHRIPAIYHASDFVAAGGLISYGADVSEGARVVRAYTARILRGARPGDLPVQQPSRFKLNVNLKTAKALGLTIPPTILARAYEVIE